MVANIKSSNIVYCQLTCIDQCTIHAQCIDMKSSPTLTIYSIFLDSSAIYRLVYCRLVNTLSAGYGYWLSLITNDLQKYLLHTGALI